MGLYDRDYYRDERGSVSLLASKPMVTILIVITVAVFFLQFLSGDWLTVWLSARPQTLLRPWLWWQFITYGFVHHTGGIGHILFNMLGLYFLGPPVEARLGRTEFLRFYLVAIALGGIFYAARMLLVAGWTLMNSEVARAMPLEDVAGPPVIGASGAVNAVVLLFVFANPMATLRLYFLIPIPAWLLGAAIILGNIFFASPGVANDVHLVGIAFAAAYHYGSWNLRWLSPAWLTDLPDRLRRRRPKLRLHDPDTQAPETMSRDESAEADRILQKIHDQGEASLTAAERKTLERYSRKVRQRRR